MHFDLVETIKLLGMLGVWAIVFAESGLFFGFFLPGDSLLFTAGFLASQGFLTFIPLVVGCFIAAVAGDSVGYAFGRRVGHRIFFKENSFFFNRAYMERTQKFYEKHGKRTIIIARFIPIVRTFAPIFAGVGKMHYRDFALYNVIGGFLWAVGVTSAGYFLGNTIPDIDRYLIPIVIGIIVVSLIPGALHLLRAKKENG
ncbi:MAG: VTT domain-containing protein [bacterium]|nr:VTT domain-containing protein [bacterium]